MSKPAENLPDKRAVLKAIIAILRVHDQQDQALRLRIAKLQKLAFGRPSGKVECEIGQLATARQALIKDRTAAKARFADTTHRLLSKQIERRVSQMRGLLTRRCHNTIQP